MVADNSSDKLPPGWKEYVKVKNGKKIKYYSKAETGQKFYSKLAVIRYMNMKIDGADSTRPQSETDCNQTPETPINHRKKVSVEEAVTDEPDTNRSPVWLPAGWITKVKPRTGSRATYKIYIEPATGKKFYSQPQVSEYLKALAEKEVPVQKSQDAAETNKSPVELPPGWMTEVKSRSSGSTYKIYIDPDTGRKFRSMSQVSQYLETLAQKEVQVKTKEITAVGMSASETDVYEQQESVKKKGCRSRKEKDVVQSGSLDGLPVGWTKEIKIRHSANGIKRDPYYKDPVSGYVFRSKKDALRYLDTGDISKCSIRPLKREELNAVSEEYASSNELSGHHISTKDQRSISQREVDKVSNYSGEPVINDQFQKTAVDGLPIGWIREIQIRRDGHGKDSLYTDPNSGYMFRSKKDALRYIETGDISKCVCKPKIREANDIGSAKQACGDQLQNPAEVGLPIGWTKEIQIRKNGIGKDYFYTDPISGYMFRSKLDALRYIETGDVSKCAIKPTKRDANDTGSTKQQVSGNDLSQHHKSCKDKHSTSKQEETKISNYSGRPIQNSAVDGLPIGWTREIQTRRHGIGRDTFYTDPVSGYIFRSKKDALRYIETGDISKCAIKPKKRSSDDTGSTKQVSSDQLNNSAVDGLPIGWVREIQTRRDGIGKDSFYTDPVSGYIFRSKIDALRYIETGDISKCASIPKKRDAYVAGSTEYVGNPLTPATRRNLPRSSNRQHFIGEKSNDGGENCDASNSMEVKSESSLRKRLSSLPRRIERKSRKISQPSELEFQENNLCQSADSRSSCKQTSQSTPGRTSKRLAGCQPEMPNLQVSERDLRAAMKMSCEDEANLLPMISINAFPNELPQSLYPDPASVDANPSHEQNLPKQIINKKVNRNTPENSKKSNKRIEPSTPGRSSNFQTVSGYQSPSNSQLREGSLGAEMRKSSEDETHVFPWININDVPDVVPQPFYSELSTTTAVGMSPEGEPYPLYTEPAPEEADIVSMDVESVSNMDAGQKFKEHSASQQINEKEDLQNLKPQDVQGGYQFVDPSPNPFMNFSFNNPTGGATPDMDNLAYQGYSQQQTSNPFVHGNEYTGWPSSQSLGYSQDGNPSNSDSGRLQAQVNQFSFVIPGFGVPSFSSSDSQHPASDNRNNIVFKKNI